MAAEQRTQVVGPAAASGAGDLSPAGRGRLSRSDLNSMAAAAASPGGGLPATSTLPALMAMRDSAAAHSTGGLPASSTPMARRDSAAKPVATNNQPLVGADRYEEIIKARDRSSSRGPGSSMGSMTNLFQPGITMAMREETKQMSLVIF